MNENSNINQRNSYWVLVAAIIAAGLIVSTWIFSNGLVKSRATTNTITVTGSAKKEIKSDWIVWSGSYSFQSPTLTEAYKGLVSSRNKVKAFFLSKGISENQLILSSVSTTINKVIVNGQETDQISSYTVSENIEIRSNEVDKITELSRIATELINQGVEFESYAPEYFYTKIANLKVEMISLATKDALNRAQKIAENTNSRIGVLKSARQGVFQITPLYSNEISDSGVNDTSSLEKEITAVVNCSFIIQK